MIEDLCEGAMMIDMVEQCFRNEDPMASPRILDRSWGWILGCLVSQPEKKTHNKTPTR